ncbi:MAG: hypothetical protein WDA72_12485 [Desulfomonilia bacterium]|nr:hypothetical protein [Deltaproteobacteria bacterium]
MGRDANLSNACREDGEFHTVVAYGPLFQRPITILPGERLSNT